MRRVLAGMLLLAVGVLGTGQAFAAPKGSDVKASLLADVSAIQAGTPFTLAITLTTQPGWHVYWKNPGDAGSATEFTFHLPEGYKVDAVQFPLPIKFTQAGDIVAYGYTGTAVFLATVTPPAKIESPKLTLGVDVSWLSCSEVCVPGGAKLKLDLAAQHVAENAALIGKAREMMPAAEAPKDTVERVETVKGETGQAGLEIVWKKQPKGEVEFFPLTPEGVALSDMKVQQEAGKTLYLVNWRAMAGNKEPPQPLQMLVVYRDDAGVRHGFFSTIDLRK